MLATMWLALGMALLLPLLCFILGQLSLERDIFFLLVYIQSVIYVDIAPTFASPDVNLAMQQRYAWIQLWAFALFQLPFLVLYIFVRRRRERRYPRVRRFTVSAGRLAIFFTGCLLLAVAYFIVGTKYGLLYRRVGERLSMIQLSMSIVEFALYRTFIEVGPFLLATQVFLLRTPSDMTPALRRVARLGLAVTILLYFGYVLVNSRLNAIITLATLYGFFTILTRNRGGFRLGRMFAAALVGLIGIYMIRVVENVRLSFASGESIFAPANFLPFAIRDEKQDDTLRWRLNGVDLIAIISRNVEAEGPALGGAWAVPAILSLDPIVRTAFTVQAKRANLTSSKTILLLRYGGVAKADYYSCMLTDAYGNFSIFGFLLVAVFLATALGCATAAIRSSPSHVGVLLAAFAITRLLPFEQEFGSLLYGWYKVLPFVALVLIFYPLRRGGSRPAEDRSTPVGAGSLAPAT
jgi:hypothetical protein